MDITSLYQWFHTYSNTFYSADAETMRGVCLKENHSVRVASNSLSLARHLGLGERELAMAEAIGLLHDVARHKQWTQFKSFNDVVTNFDHGTEGAILLGTKGILHSCFDLAEQDTILFAITHHNKLSVPEDEPKKVQMANIIRDADKLDIFRTLPALPLDHDYSPTMVRLLQLQHPLPYSEAKKPADRLLLRLSWLYDVNFKWTLYQLVSEGHADNLLSSLPDNDVFAKIISNLRNLLNESNVKCI